jgi:hypothetical protein
VRLGAGLLAAAVAFAPACGDDGSSAADGGAESQDAAPEIDAGPKGDRWFHESAKILTLREQPGIYLDEQREEEIDALLTRAKMVDIDTDAVIFMNIFARPIYLMDQINLWSSDPAVQEGWEQGKIITGDPELDDLLASLEPIKIEPYSLGLVQLWFARWVDIDELIARLEEFDYLDAYSVCTCMDGDDIVLVDEETVARFTFYVRWDDCFSGCLNAHWWEVVVPHDPELPAEVVDEGGNPLPP